MEKCGYRKYFKEFIISLISSNINGFFVRLSYRFLTGVLYLRLPWSRKFMIYGVITYLLNK